MIDQCLVEKLKPLHKYYHDAVGTGFNIKLAFHPKFQN